ncbi:MAG: hypothetical protein E7040_09230 [Lentisphaerae bacterium]|nr:hypothetical protein [Lentisphaerota bacterium]
MKKFLTAITFAAVAVCMTACSTFQTAEADSPNTLKIGWAKRSIAKEGPVPITGQFYLRISQGQYTPVLASALAISTQKDSVIFVSLDIVSFSADTLKKVHAILKKEAPGIPVEKIILNASHTHAGPSSNVIPSDYPRQLKVTPTEEMQAWLARQVAEAVKEAWAKRAPGSIAYGYGFATTGHSRRVVYMVDKGKQEKNYVPGLAMNGHAKMYGNTNDKDFDRYEAGTDAFINLMYTFDAKGKLTGAVINVPCPAQTSEHVWMLYASFWHYVRADLQKKYGDIGVIGQSAAAGDLSPRQLHYNAAEKRRYALKYKDQIEAYMKNPMVNPNFKNWTPEQVRRQVEFDILELMRAVDIASRITTAFDEVLSWAGKDKKSAVELKHDVKTVNLSRRMFPKALIDQEKKNHAAVMKMKYKEGGDPLEQLMYNSRLRSRRGRIAGLLARYEIQDKEPGITTDIHVVKFGNIAFATNRFELYLDYQHRIQARSPFEQTFIVQLVTDVNGIGSYLATEQGVRNKGYSATPYCNQVSPKGGQELVNETLNMLNKVK